VKFKRVETTAPLCTWHGETRHILSEFHKTCALNSFISTLLYENYCWTT